jgi:hypothetical protein
LHRGSLQRFALPLFRQRVAEPLRVTSRSRFVVSIRCVNRTFVPKPLRKPRPLLGEIKPSGRARFLSAGSRVSSSTLRCGWRCSLCAQLGALLHPVENPLLCFLPQNGRAGIVREGHLHPSHELRCQRKRSEKCSSSRANELKCSAKNSGHA